jgi:hypothetical protein
LASSEGGRLASSGSIKFCCLPSIANLLAGELTSSVTFPGTHSILALGSVGPASRGIPSFSPMPDPDGFWIWGGKIELVDPLSEFLPLDWDPATTKNQHLLQKVFEVISKSKGLISASKS